MGCVAVFSLSASMSAPLGPRDSDKRRIGPAGWVSRKPDSVAGSVIFSSWSGTDKRWRHRQRGEACALPPGDRSIQTNLVPIAIGSAGGSFDAIGGPSRLTGPHGEPVPAKVTGGADRRHTKSRRVRDKGERLSPSRQVRAERSSRGTGPRVRNPDERSSSRRVKDRGCVVFRGSKGSEATGTRASSQVTHSVAQWSSNCF